MSKLFSNKVFLQIFSVVMLVLMINSYTVSKTYKEYAYKSISISLDRAIDEIVDINTVVFGIYDANDFDKDYVVKYGYIYYFERLDIRIDNMFETKTYPFSWFHLEDIWFNVRDIKEKGSLSKEDEEYLKKVHMYNQELINAYYRVIEDRIDYDYTKAKQEYKNFIEEANRITVDPKYKGIFEYKVNK